MQIFVLEFCNLNAINVTNVFESLPIEEEVKVNELRVSSEFLRLRPTPSKVRAIHSKNKAPIDATNHLRVSKLKILLKMSEI